MVHIHEYKRQANVACWLYVWTRRRCEPCAKALTPAWLDTIELSRPGKSCRRHSL